MEKNMREKYCIQAVDNALHLLETLCDSEHEVNLTELSQRMGLRKSTIFRLLVTFQRRGYAEKEGSAHGYRIGPSVFRIGHKCLSQMTLLGKTRPVMESLARRSRESVYLAVRRGREIDLIDFVDSPQKVRVTCLIGRQVPLGGTAAGEVFAAFDKGGPDADISAEGRMSVRQRGYAQRRNDIAKEVVSLAAPLLDYQNRMAGALLLVVPEFRLGSERSCSQRAEQLVAAASEISMLLGHFKSPQFAKGA